MTLKELSQLYYLKREIENDRRRLKELEATLSSPSSPNFSGMPRSTAYGNKIELSVADIIDLKAIIAAKQHERKRLERYIAEISDSLTREIFTFRFVNGFSWRQVAKRVGGDNTEENVKKICYRYLDNKNRKVDNKNLKSNSKIKKQSQN